MYEHPVTNWLDLNRYHLTNSGYLNEEQVRFVVAEVGCALDYLRTLDVIHREGLDSGFTDGLKLVWS